MKRVKYQLKIGTANDAAQGNVRQFVADMLRQAAQQLEEGAQPDEEEPWESTGPLRDVNGNTVGHWDLYIDEV